MTKLASVLARAKMIRADIGNPSCVPGAELAVRLGEALDALEEAREILERSFTHCHSTHASWTTPDDCAAALCQDLRKALGR